MAPGICGCRNSATTGMIHSKLSSLETSWPVHVQRYSHLPIGGIMGVSICVISAPGILLTPELSNQWADEFEIKIIRTILAYT